MSSEMSIFMPDCPHGHPFGSRCEDCIALAKRTTSRLPCYVHRWAAAQLDRKSGAVYYVCGDCGVRRPPVGLDIRSALDRVGQCPGCYSLHSVPPEMDWECDCGEAVTIIDLRAKPRHPKWTDMPTGGPW
jgi:hypothetical protein